MLSQLLALAGIPRWLVRPTVRLTAWHLLLVTAITALKSGTNALFLSRADPKGLVFLYVAVAVVVFAVTSVLARVMSRARPGRVLGHATRILGATVLLAGLATAYDAPYSTGVLYVLGEVYATTLSILFWARVADALTPRNQKRVIGVVSAGGMAGAMFGGLLMRALPGVTGVLVPSVAGVVLVAAALPWLRGLRSHARKTARRPSLGPAFRYLSSHPYAVSVAGLVFTLAVMGAVVDFVFRIEAASLASETEMAGLFGLLNAAVGGSVVVFQFALTSRLLSRFGLFAFLGIVPAALLVLSAGYGFFDVGLSLLIAIKGVEMAGAFSLYNAGVSLLYNPVPGEHRSAVRTLIDGAVKKGGAAFGGLALAAWVYVLGAHVDARTITVLSMVLLVGIASLRKLYLRALDEKLGARRSRGAEALIDLRDRATIRALLRAVDSEDPDRVVLALVALDDGVRLEHALLIRLLEHPDERVRTEALKHVPDRRDKALAAHLFNMLSSETARRPRSEAVRAYGRAGGDDVKRRIRPLLDSEDPGLVAGVIEVLLPDNDARARLDGLVKRLTTLDAAWRREIARLLGRLGEYRYDAALAALIDDEDSSVRALAVDAAGRELHEAHLSSLIDHLTDRELRASVRQALAAYGDVAVPALSMALDDRSAPIAVRLQIPRVLEAIATEDSARALLYSNPVDDPLLQRRIADSLVAIVSAHGELSVGRSRLAEAFHRRVEWFETFARAEVDLEADGSPALHEVIKLVRHRRQESLRIALQLLGVVYGTDRMRIIYRGLVKSGAERQDAIELLDAALVGSPIRERMLELLDERRQASSRSAEECLLAFLDEPDRLLRALARRALNKLAQDGTRPAPTSTPDHAPLEVPMAKDDDIADELVERMMFLESVDFFEGLSPDELLGIAAICVEETHPPGAVIYREGDPGDCLYAIEDGAIETVHEGDLVMVLKGGESLGQVSFLDQGTRPVTARVTGKEPARLLRIERAAFMELLHDRPGLMKSFLGVLGHRLRALIHRTGPTS